MITQEDLTKESKARSISLEQLAQGQEVPSADLGELEVLGKPASTPYEGMHSQFPYELAKEYCLVPLRLIDDGLGKYLGTIIVVMADVNNSEAQEHLRNLDNGISAGGHLSDNPISRAQASSSYRILVQTAPEETIRKAIDRFYSEEAAHERIGEAVLPVLRMMDEFDKVTNEYP